MDTAQQFNYTRVIHHRAHYFASVFDSVVCGTFLQSKHTGCLMYKLLVGQVPQENKYLHS